MNGKMEENHNFLTSEVLPNVGFAGVFDQELLAKMKKGGEVIELAASAPYGKDQKDKVDFVLTLNYHDPTERYYLNEIKGTLTKEGQDPVTHNFKLYNQRGYDADKIYNMLDNRFVYKEYKRDGELKQVWSKINPSVKDDDGNNIMQTARMLTPKFNPVIELGKLPIVYMSQADKENAIRDMQKGETPITTIKKPDGSRETVTLVARPDIGRIDMYNKEGKLVRLAEKNIVSLQASKFTTKSQEQNNGITDTPKNTVENTAKESQQSANQAQDRNHRASKFKTKGQEQNNGITDAAKNILEKAAKETQQSANQAQGRNHRA